MAEWTFVAGEVPTASQWNTRVRDQVVRVVTSSTRPSAPVEGSTIFETDTDKTLIYDGSAWVEQMTIGAWKTYTPTWAATGAPSLGNGTITGRYQRIGGRTLIVHIELTWGSTTTGGSGAWKFTLPSSLVANNTWQLSSGAIYDSSAGTVFDAVTTDAGSGSLFAYYRAVSGSNVVLSTVTTSAPMTWATSDYLHLTVVLETTA